MKHEEKQRLFNYFHELTDGKVLLMEDDYMFIENYTSQPSPGLREVIDVLKWLSDESDFDLTGRNYYRKEDHDGDQPIEPKDVLAQYPKLKSITDEPEDLIIHALEEGSELWQSEYEMCRLLLQNLVTLKGIKDTEGKTEYYETNQPLAWEAAINFLKDFQHY